MRVRSIVAHASFVAVLATRIAAADAVPTEDAPAPQVPVAAPAPVADPAPLVLPAAPQPARLVATLLVHVPAGKQPTTSLLVDSGRTLLVANRGDNTLSVFATDGMTLTKTIPDVGYSAWGLADRGNGKVLVANWAGSSIAFVDVGTGKRTGEAPTGMKPSYLAVSPDGKRAYAAGNFSDDVTITDLTTRKVVRHVEVGRRPMGVALSADGRTLWVAVCESKKIAKIGLDGVQLDQIAAPLAATTNLALSADGRTLLAAGEGGKLLAIDVASGAVDAIPAGSDLSSVAITPEGRIALAADYASGSVGLVDLATREHYASVPVGVGPIDVRTDGRRFYTCNDKAGTVSVFRLDPPAAP